MKQFTIRVRIGHGPQKGLLLRDYGPAAITREMIESRYGPVPNKAYRVTYTLRKNGRYGVDKIDCCRVLCIWPDVFLAGGQRFSRKVW